MATCFLGVPTAQAQISNAPKVGADGTIQVKAIQVAPNTYFVQGVPEMGSKRNQNFISNAGFVVTPKGL